MKISLASILLLFNFSIRHSSKDHGTFGESAQTGSVNARPAATSHVLTGLRAFRTYSISVSATTGGGTGPQSTPAIIGQTAEGGYTRINIMIFYKMFAFSLR